MNIVWAALAAMMVSAGPASARENWKSLNKEAAKEYQTPIRPFTEGRNPCWNTWCNRFIYAPVFDFPKVDGAVKYRYTITQDISVTKAAVRGDDDTDAQEALARANGTTRTVAGKSFTFTASTPTEALTPIWADIPVGKVILKVEGLDRDGKVIGIAGERRFMRDFPFDGPYPGNVRPYREAALMGMLYIHTLPQIQHWKTSTTPDMSYRHNTYANKIIGKTVSVEALLGSHFPEYREDAIAIAKGAAQFLIDQSRPEGEPLAFFPPTYYGGLIASKKEANKGKVMTTDPCYAANGFLDLFDVTGDSLYWRHAVGIADTYVHIQRPDGSMPIKMDIATGEPVNGACAMLTPVMNLVRRLQRQYGVHDYDGMLSKAESWMQTVALETFDMTGQFEDVSVDVKPYQNLTNATASGYASYLLSDPSVTPAEIADARDLIRLSEDQFVHWDALPDANGIRRTFGPCVYEQLKYQTPVDNSSCNVANAYLSLYEATGDKLAFAKAKALIDALTVAQQVTNGMTPTTLDYRNPQKDKGRTFWLNCSVATITIWLRMAYLVGE